MDDALVLEQTVGRARPRWRDRRVLALLAAAVIVAVVSQVLGSSPRAELATAEQDDPPSAAATVDESPTTSSTTTSTIRPTTTTLPTTTTSEVEVDRAAPSTSQPAGVDAPEIEPPVARIHTTTTIRPTTTTTVDPHPWEPVLIEFFQADNWDPEVALLAVNVTGIFDHYVLDFGDGESMVFKSPSPFCNPGYDATAGWTHDYTEDGVYTARVTVYGSRDCDTAPASYRPTVATTLVTVPLPQG
jgi:hypothetical protein